MSALRRELRDQLRVDAERRYVEAIEDYQRLRAYRRASSLLAACVFFTAAIAAFLWRSKWF